MNNNFNYENFKNMNCNGFIDHLLSLSANELSLLAIAIGYGLTINTDINQQNSLGNFFELLGQLLLTISAQNIQLQPNYPSRSQLQEQINQLQLEISKIKKLIR